MFFRYLAALGFIAFVSAAVAFWIIPAAMGESPAPWWIPFAAGAGFPAMVGTAILIMSPDEWRK